MVRRWSHINNLNVSNFSNISDISNISFFLLKKKYKFINFKSVVGLKRFNKKYTKFKRKAFNRMKHINNWYVYHNVFKYWSLDYFFVKKYYKFQFLKNIFNETFLFYNFFLNNYSKKFFLSQWNFIFFNLIKKNINYFFSNKNLFSDNYSYLQVINKTKFCKNFNFSYGWSNNAITLNNFNVLFFKKNQNNLFLFSSFLSKDKIFKIFASALQDLVLIVNLKFFFFYYKQSILFLK